MGEKVRADDVVLIFSEVKQTTILHIGDQSIQATGKWVVAYGTAYNPTDDRISLFPHDFVLSASSVEGYMFADEEATAAVEQLSGINGIIAGSVGNDIQPGETSRIAVAFDVPDVSGDLTLWVVRARTGIDLGPSASFEPLQTATPTQTATPKPTLTPTPTYTPTPLPTRGPGTDVTILSNHSWYEDELFGDTCVVGEVLNNTGYSIPPVEVRIDFYDENGKTVGTGVGFTELSNLPATDKTCFKACLEDAPEWSTYQFQLPIYELIGEPAAEGLTILDHTGAYDPDSGNYSIVGRVLNTGDSRARVVEVIGTLYDASGTVIGCEWQPVDYMHIDPGQVSFFEIAFLDRDYSDVDSYRLQVYGEPIEIADMSDPFAPTSATGIGVSRAEFINVLEPLGIRFEPKPGPRGRFYVEGHKGEAPIPDVAVDLIGPSDNILRAEIWFFLSADFTEEDALSYIETFMAVAVPDWKDGMRWVRANLGKVRKTGQTQRMAWGELEIDLGGIENYFYVLVEARR